MVNDQPMSFRDSLHHHISLAAILLSVAWIGVSYSAAQAAPAKMGLIRVEPSWSQPGGAKRQIFLDQQSNDVPILKLSLHSGESAINLKNLHLTLNRGNGLIFKDLKVKNNSGRVLMGPINPVTWNQSTGTWSGPDIYTFVDSFLMSRRASTTITVTADISLAPGGSTGQFSVLADSINAYAGTGATQKAELHSFSAKNQLEVWSNKKALSNWLSSQKRK